ncbi:metallophosphoesterase [Tardiphaga sp.]|uniref:metallophosphoesterase n=1 Tax=Tardiphaga sp. TaxID=1926292 RepID=UPI00260C4C1E|nr:metallophosphoesterase [Tardiphaga sp.]MDB5616484.1 metallophosphoesterase [Tardiphaga sp.]
MLASSLIYAISDIHGCFDLLTALLDFVTDDAERRRQEPRIIFLGDIVDRGPDNRGCIELVVSTLERRPKSRLVLGNHDDWFLRALGTDDLDSAVVASWVRNGRLSTLYNYDHEADLSMARAAVKIDYQHHISLFQEASLLEIDGPFAFVHAGVNSERPIDNQERTDCRSIRKPFLEYPEHLSHIVVHGHTITDTRCPLVTQSRIALDTGAYGTGHLTTLIIDPVADSLEFAWTVQSDSEITVELIEPDVTSVPERLHDHFNTTSTMHSAQ